jgi:hypothetical protein
MNHDIEVCPHCRSPVGFRFGDFGICFYWVKNYYFMAVVLFVEDYVLRLFCESWVSDANVSGANMSNGSE